MFGRDQFKDVNALLNSRLSDKNPLITVHRGTGLGMIVENTAPAITAALRSGADMVELDIIESTDGAFYVFHDGMERECFGIDKLITTLSSAEIDDLVYIKTAELNVHVERFERVLRSFPGVLFNIDRSWFYWDRLLPWLDQFDMANQLILKAPPAPELLEILRKHPVKYPLVAIVTNKNQLDNVLNDPDINLVGIEPLIADPSNALCDPQAIRAFQESGFFVYLNALDLPAAVLMAGWDDTISITGDPDDGWGHIVSLGADVIQTDWPALLNAYLGRDIRPLSKQKYMPAMERSQN